MNEITVKEKNGQLVVSSREVAEHFGKRHDKLTAEIERMYGDLIGYPQNGGHPLFLENFYIHPQNKQEYKEYLMTRDGFSLLVMGFTGKDALRWKLKYIEAFNTMEERLKSGNQLTEEERLKLQLFSKDASEVAFAHNRLVELATNPLVAKIEEQTPKVQYHDNVLNKDGLINITTIAKDLGLSSARKLNDILHRQKIIYKDNAGSWQPYSEYEWLVTEGYADYKSYENKDVQPILKWTEKGRKWIMGNISKWRV